MQDHFVIFTARLDDLQNAHDTFRYAMDLARLLGNVHST